MRRENSHEGAEIHEAGALNMNAKACSSRDYLMLRTLWRTGIRVGELLSIKPQDLEPHNQVINITIIKAKGNKQRRVMLNPETLDRLSKHICSKTSQSLNLC